MNSIKKTAGILHLPKHVRWVVALMPWLFNCMVFSVQAGPFVVDVITDKAMYSPGANTAIYVDLTNSTSSVFSGAIQVTITHLGYVSTNLPAQSVLNLSPHSTSTIVFSWPTPPNNFQGYLVSALVLDQGSNVVDNASSAIDVSSDWNKFPRYGYVAQYGSTVNTTHTMWLLKNYHLNGIQFYDWQWKHHIPYNSGSTWPDVANRTIYRTTVTNLINSAHAYGMMAMNYNSYGMAYANYLTDGSGVTLSMGIFSSPTASIGNQYGYSLPNTWATTNLFGFNNRDVGWQNYIYGREQAVFTNIAFDGWHIDTVGQNTAYDSSGNFFNLTDYNAQFINNAKATLGKRMTFNTADAGGENQVAQGANVDFVYSELWSGNPNYNSFNQRVNNVRSYCSKALVMPAYMDSGLSSGIFNTPGVLLTDAAMFACGGSHLELGDGSEMLNNAYFPSDGSVLMSSSLTAAMHAYYDFLVSYENLLRGDTVSANNAATITGVTTSTNGAAGAVWVISKKTLGANIIHLINLLNNPSPAWNDYNGTYPSPATLNNLAVKMYYTGSISGGNLWYATPDTNSCAATQLNYTTGSDGGGNYINFTVPQLQYWDMVWLEINGTNNAAARIQAENYDSMSGIGTETTSDTGGGSDVAFVNNLTGDSYVAFNNVDFGVGATGVSVRAASAVANGAVEFHLDGPAGLLIANVSVGNTGGWQTWQTLNAPVSWAYGVHKLFVVFKNAPANLNWFNFTVPLPAPWVTQDIGAVGLTGSATYSSGTFTVTGAGSDIESTADAFRYVGQPSSGDCSVIARVVTQQNTDSWAKSGVMIRETTNSNSINATLVITPGNGVNFQRRIITGGGTTSSTVAGVATPQWLKLTRTGKSFAAYYSANGTAWTPVGTAQTITMASNATMGLAVTAHNATLLSAATMDNVTTTGGTIPAPPAVPAGLTATGGNSQVALSWTAVAGAVSYNLKQTILNGGPYTNIFSLNSTNYVDTNLINGTTYYYVVSAVNSGGESSNSSQVSISLNQAPVLSAVLNQVIIAGATLIVTNSASDLDIPAQSLIFSLSSAPTNAMIDSSSGMFTWRPTVTQLPSTQTVSVVVTDNGVPPLSATQSFMVTVTLPAQPSFSGISITNGCFGFWTSGDIGPDYTIQASTDLISWTALTTAYSPTLPFFWADTNSGSSMFQFYRVVLGP